MIRKLKMIGGAIFVLFLLKALIEGSGSSEGYGPVGNGDPDFYGIMDRMVVVAEAFDQVIASEALDTKEVTPTTADEATMTLFTETFEQAINATPALYKEPMGVSYLSDGSFRGWADSDGDGQKGIDEPKLFTIELDLDNRRIVCTDETGVGYGFSGLGTGLLAGAVMGNLMGRQASAGVSPTRFAGRPVVNRSAGAVRSARSSARTGGARVGK
jgi:hypothetical protein